MKKPFLIHPFLFAFYPTLFIFSHNVVEVPLSEIFLPLTIMLLIAGFLMTGFNFFLKNPEKSALITSLFIILFFSYQQFQLPFQYKTVLGIDVGRHRFFFPFISLIFILTAFVVISTRKNLNPLNQGLNKMAALLICFSIGLAGYQLARRDTVIINGPQFSHQENWVSLAPFKKPAKLPNIYYIILDGYARGDILQEVYHYDNSDFLSHLVQKGFCVNDQSRSNYPYTVLSLASSLNFTYLDDLAGRMDPNSHDITPLFVLIRNNRTAVLLKNLGYQFVTFSTGSPHMDIEDADIFVRPRWGLSSFQTMLLRMTPILHFIESIWGPYFLYWPRYFYVFDQLAELGLKKQPVFVFAHIMAPHPPFLFGKGGEKTVPKTNFLWDIELSERYKYQKEYQDAYIEDYRNYLVFTTQKIEGAIDEILSKSSEPPIIILQSDHGPAFLANFEHPTPSFLKERMSILSAYYFPGKEYKEFYRRITPVNTFRILFNEYFDAGLDLLPNENYYSYFRTPYQLQNVTQEIP